MPSFVDKALSRCEPPTANFPDESSGHNLQRDVCHAVVAEVIVQGLSLSQGEFANAR